MESLNIRTLGDTRIQITGQDVKWSAQSARDLLLYLLSFPEGRTRAQIFEDLWQAEVEARTGNRFRVVLHRLRAVLGGTNAIEEKDGRYRLAPEVWRSCDVYRFYSALKAAEDAHHPVEKRTALQRATELYSGNYLPEVEADWAVMAREEHQAAYVQAHLELSLLHCETGACALSVVSLVRALKTDPYVGEHYHQRLMTCLSVVEDKYASIEHYRRFLHFLREDIRRYGHARYPAAGRAHQGRRTHLPARRRHPAPSGASAPVPAGPGVPGRTGPAKPAGRGRHARDRPATGLTGRADRWSRSPPAPQPDPSAVARHEQTIWYGKNLPGSIARAMSWVWACYSSRPPGRLAATLRPGIGLKRTTR